MRYAAGTPIRPSFRFLVHLVAIRYGTTPAAVRSWPAADFLEAAAYLPYTGGAPDARD